jgi:hypothetical protein
VRDWLPERRRAVLFGLLGATVGGALVIRPDGIDFTAVEPHWAAVTMFILLLAAYGVAVSVTAERLIGSTDSPGIGWRWLAVLPLLLLLLGGVFGLVLLILVGVAIAFNRSGSVTRLWRSRPATWLGRGVLATVFVASGALLISNVAAVL